MIAKMESINEDSEKKDIIQQLIACGVIKPEQEQEAMERIEIIEDIDEEEE